MNFLQLKRSRTLRCMDVNKLLASPLYFQKSFNEEPKASLSLYSTEFIMFAVVWFTLPTPLISDYWHSYLLQVCIRIYIFMS
jgi:hypothetical protein